MTDETLFQFFFFKLDSDITKVFFLWWGGGERGGGACGWGCRRLHLSWVRWGWGWGYFLQTGGGLTQMLSEKSLSCSLNNIFLWGVGGTHLHLRGGPHLHRVWGVRRDTHLQYILFSLQWHYNGYDDIVSQSTSLTIVYSIVYSDADQRKHQSSASLAFVRGIHQGPVNSPHKWPVTQKMFPFDDVIMTSMGYGVSGETLISNIFIFGAMYWSEQLRFLGVLSVTLIYDWGY